jgi:hypothetical protein
VDERVSIQNRQSTVQLKLKNCFLYALYLIFIIKYILPKFEKVVAVKEGERGVAYQPMPCVHHAIIYLALPNSPLYTSQSVSTEKLKL